MHAPRTAPAARLLTLAASFGFVVVQLDVTIVNVALPSLGRGFAVGVESLQWVVDAYTLAFAVLLLSAGALGDRFGARQAYLAGFAVFALASAACGLAPGAPALVAARALQGAGAALMVPNSLALLNGAHHGDAAGRAKAVGAWTAAGGVSIAAGPLLGGLMVAAFGWRSIFLVNLPLCALGAWLTLLATVREPRPPKPRPLDLAGQALAALALTGLIGAVIELRARGLADPLVLGGLAVSVAGGLAFAAVERRAAAPMLPLQVFRHPAFAAAVGFGVIVNLAYYGTIFVLTLYLQQGRGWSPLQAGLAFLPLTATFIVSNLVSGRMTARLGSKAPMVAGAAIAALGYALLLPLDGQSPFARMLPAFLLIPSGMGLAVPAMTTAILAAVDKPWAGVASAVLNAARQGGGAVGVAAFGLAAGTFGAVGGLHAAAAASALLLLLGAVASGAWIAGRSATD
jgi:DHA2 family methylenomycin A resistance protein-like MFS transporter